MRYKGGIVSTWINISFCRWPQSFFEWEKQLWKWSGIINSPGVLLNLLVLKCIIEYENGQVIVVRTAKSLPGSFCSFCKKIRYMKEHGK